jgi:hypothetical protein
MESLLLLPLPYPLGPVALRLNVLLPHQFLRSRQDSRWDPLSPSPALFLLCPIDKVIVVSYSVTLIFLQR